MNFLNFKIYSYASSNYKEGGDTKQLYLLLNAFNLRH